MTAPFKSAHDALTFAFRYYPEQYARTPMSRLAIPPVGNDTGLVGLDGAAQAGMILAEVNKLKDLERAYIILKYAPVSIPCRCGMRCCKGSFPNPEWTNALGVLSLYLKEVNLAKQETTIAMRYDYLRKLLFRREHPSYRALAKRHDINEKTVRRHLLIVRSFLYGGSDNGKPIDGLAYRAMISIEDQLLKAGITVNEG